MSEEGGDKLAVVRAAGAMIRDALASNMLARVGDVVEMEVLAETRDVLASILQSYLEQIIPNVKVEGIFRVRPNHEKPESIEFTLSVTGGITVSISPGAEDDTLPDPKPGPRDVVAGSLPKGGSGKVS